MHRAQERKSTMQSARHPTAIYILVLIVYSSYRLHEKLSRLLDLNACTPLQLGVSGPSVWQTI